MASTFVELANLALSYVTGRDRIAAFTDGSPAADQCVEHYQGAVRAVLAEADWNCSLAYSTLAEVDNPSSLWSKAYALPSALIRAVEIERSHPDQKQIPFKLALAGDASERILLTNQASATLIYIAFPANPVLWPQYMVDAVALELAARIAYPLTREKAVLGTMIDMAARALSRARALDGNDGREAMDADAGWIEARE